VLLAELIEDLNSLTSGDPEATQVLIATREVNGVLIEHSTEVQLREIGSIELDENDSELKLVPKMISGDDSTFLSPVSVATLRNYANENPNLSDFEIYTVDRRALTEEGGTVSLNLPVLGLCGKSPTEVWILQPPQEHWPASWFSDPA